MECENIASDNYIFFNNIWNIKFFKLLYLSTMVTKLLMLELQHRIYTTLYLCTFLTTNVLSFPPSSYHVCLFIFSLVIVVKI